MALILLEPFQNVVATGQAQLTTQRIWPNTLEYVSLLLGGTTFTKAMMTNLQVRLGQKTIWYATGADIQTMNAYEGHTSAVTLLQLYFANPFARTPKQQYLGAIDFGAVGIRDLTILVTITGATAPTLVAYAEVAPPKLLDTASNLLFRAILQTPTSPSGATTFQPFLVNYGQAGGALLRRLFFLTQALVTALEIKRDGLDIFEQIPVGLYGSIVQDVGVYSALKTIAASSFVYDAILDNIETKALTTVRKDSQGNISLIPQQINISHSGAGSYNIYADVLANLNGL